ncbi:MAG TPA: ABC transporter permease [Bryobacteraceae bacterium]|nr:ABC transporter permease [Bryobacteraceae bacterium]
MFDLVRDFRLAFRAIRQNKSVTAIAVLALALGVGPNTAIFTVIYATLFAPMPYPHADRLVMVWSRIQGSRNGIAAGDFLDWQRESKSFSGLWAWSDFSANLGGAEGPEQVSADQVTPGQIGGLGVTPMIGRDFMAGEDQPGKDRVAILANRLWKRRFASDREIVGRTIRINSEPYTVVGVLPPGQEDRMPNELWVPLTFKPDQINHDFHWLLAMARLKPGVSIAQAQADMDAVTKHIAEQYPQDKGWGASVEPLRNDFLPKETFTAMYLLMGGVAFVLLIACANVTNLLLARATAREREIAIRASLGASRVRLFQQMLSEALVLALVGGAAGVGLGWAILKLLTAYMPANTLPSEADLTLNVPVLLFTLGATILAGLLAGSAPAFHAARLNLNTVLKQSGRAIGFGKHFTRRALVVAEFALALTLLAGAGLAIHSFWRLTRVDLGVRTDHVLTFALPVPEGRLTDADKVRRFYREVLGHVDSLPGVHSTTVTTGLPAQDAGFGMQFSIAGKPVTDPSTRPAVGFQMVTPGYFSTFGIRTIKGRPFDEHDIAGSLRVAMVDENFAARYLKGLDPLQQRLLVQDLVPGVAKLGPSQEWQIVGVFHNVVYGGRPDQGRPVMYVPFWQSPWPYAAVAVRTAGDPAAITSGVRAAIRSMDPDLPVAQVETMDQIVSDAHAGDRFTTVLFASFAAVALLLAVLGIYGVMAFLVAQRTHEIGLRIALGAGRRHVLQMVIGEGLRLAAVGLAFGLVGAWLVGRSMQSLLFGATSLDFTAFGVVAALMVLSAILACCIPARRAAWVDPIVALREE